MRVLLDECVPASLHNSILGYDVKTVADMGWPGVKNGELMRLTVSQFDVLLTVDRNLEYQQNFAGLLLALIVSRIGAKPTHLAPNGSRAFYFAAAQRNKIATQHQGV